MPWSGRFEHLRSSSAHGHGSSVNSWSSPLTVMPIGTTIAAHSSLPRYSLRNVAGSAAFASTSAEPSNNATVASAVTGVSRMPLRPCPVADDDPVGHPADQRQVVRGHRAQPRRASPQLVLADAGHQGLGVGDQVAHAGDGDLRVVAAIRTGWRRRRCRRRAAPGRRAGRARCRGWYALGSRDVTPGRARNRRISPLTGRTGSPGHSAPVTRCPRRDHLVGVERDRDLRRPPRTSSHPGVRRTAPLQGRATAAGCRRPVRRWARAVPSGPCGRASGSSARIRRGRESRVRAPVSRTHSAMVRRSAASAPSSATVSVALRREDVDAGRGLAVAPRIRATGPGRRRPNSSTASSPGQPSDNGASMPPATHDAPRPESGRTASPTSRSAGRPPRDRDCRRRRRRRRTPDCASNSTSLPAPALPGSGTTVGLGVAPSQPRVPRDSRVCTPTVAATVDVVHPTRHSTAARPAANACRHSAPVSVHRRPPRARRPRAVRRGRTVRWRRHHPAARQGLRRASASSARSRPRTNSARSPILRPRPRAGTARCSPSTTAPTSRWPPDADVLHLGQDDLPVHYARADPRPDVLIGRSTHSRAQASLAAIEDGVDYFCTGPVWATPTKPGRAAAGIDLVRSTANSEPTRPWFAIGGIDAGTPAGGARRGGVAHRRGAGDHRGA